MGNPQGKAQHLLAEAIQPEQSPICVRNVLVIAASCVAKAVKQQASACGVKVQSYGWEADSADPDVCEQHGWDQAWQDVTTHLNVIAIPPVCTFNMRIRGKFGSEKYGYKKLDNDKKERTRRETLVWCRAVEAAKESLLTDSKFAIVVSHAVPSPLGLDEMI